MFLKYFSLCVKYILIYFIGLFIISFILRLIQIITVDDINFAIGILSFIGVTILGYLFTLKAPERKYVYSGFASLLFCLSIAVVAAAFKIPIQAGLLYSLLPYFLCFAIGILSY